MSAPVVFHRPDRYGRGPWRVIVRTGPSVVRHLPIPDTNEATTRDDAERLAIALVDRLTVAR